MANDRIRIVLEAVDKTKKGTDSANRRLEGLGKQALQVGVAFAGIGGGAFIARAAVQQVAQFEKQMSAVAAVTGLVGDEFSGTFNALKDEAQRLGAVTTFTALQAAEGMRFLGMAGFEANEILEGTESTLRLAQAGMLDMGTAADIASNVMTQFGLSASEITRISDVLAKSAASSNTNVQQLGEALRVAGPIARALGLTLEDTVASLSALAQGGLQASLAGTGLQNILLRIIRPSKKARDTLEDMGLTLEDVNVEALGVQEVFNRLAEAEISAEEAANIFEQRGVKIALTLANQTEELQKYTDSLNESSGAADQMATIMEDNLAGSLDKLNSAISANILALAGASGDPNTLAGAMRYVIDEATGLLLVFAGMGQELGDQEAHYNRVAFALRELARAGLTFIQIRLGVYLFGVARGALQAGAALVVMQKAAFASARGIGLLGTAVRGLGAAVRVLAGPAGLLLLAAEALWSFSAAADEASFRAEDLAGEAESLQEKIDRLTTSPADRATEQRINSMQEAFKATQKEIAFSELAVYNYLDAIKAAEQTVEALRHAGEQESTSTIDAQQANIDKFKELIDEQEVMIENRRTNLILLAKEIAASERAAAAPRALPEDGVEPKGSVATTKETADLIKAIKRAQVDLTVPTQYHRDLLQVGYLLEDNREKAKGNEEAITASINLFYSQVESIEERRLQSIAEIQQQAHIDQLEGEEQALAQRMALIQSEYDQRLEIVKGNTEAETAVRLAAEKKVQDAIAESQKGTGEFTALLSRAGQNAAEQFGNSMADAFVAIADGSMSAEDAFKHFAKQFLSQILRMIIQAIVFYTIQKAINGLLGGLGGGDAGVDLSGGLGGYGEFFPNLHAGGIVTRPTLAVVGEGGEPEAVVPLSQLDSMLSGKGGSGVTINSNLTVHQSGRVEDSSAGSDAAGIQRSFNEMATAWALNQMRPGGVLARPSATGRRGV